MSEDFTPEQLKNFFESYFKENHKEFYDKSEFKKIGFDNDMMTFGFREDHYDFFGITCRVNDKNIVEFVKLCICPVKMGTDYRFFAFTKRPDIDPVYELQMNHDDRKCSLPTALTDDDIEEFACALAKEFDITSSIRLIRQVNLGIINLIDCIKKALDSSFKKPGIRIVRLDFDEMEDITETYKSLRDYYTKTTPGTIEFFNGHTANPIVCISKLHNDSVNHTYSINWTTRVLGTFPQIIITKDGWTFYEKDGEALRSKSIWQKELFDMFKKEKETDTIKDSIYKNKDVTKLIYIVFISLIHGFHNYYYDSTKDILVEVQDKTNTKTAIYDVRQFDISKHISLMVSLNGKAQWWFTKWLDPSLESNTIKFTFMIDGKLYDFIIRNDHASFYIPDDEMKRLPAWFRHAYESIRSAMLEYNQCCATPNDDDDVDVSQVEIQPEKKCLSVDTNYVFDNDVSNMIYNAFKFVVDKYTKHSKCPISRIPRLIFDKPINPTFFGYSINIPIDHNGRVRQEIVLRCDKIEPIKSRYEATYCIGCGDTCSHSPLMISVYGGGYCRIGRVRGDVSTNLFVDKVIVILEELIKHHNDSLAEKRLYELKTAHKEENNMNNKKNEEYIIQGIIPEYEFGKYYKKDGDKFVIVEDDKKWGSEVVYTNEGSVLEPEYKKVKFSTAIATTIKDVIFSDPVTTVIWADGTKTSVSRQVTKYQPTITSTGAKDVPVERVPFDPEAALAAAIMNKLFGTHSRYSKFVKGYVAEAEEKVKKKAELKAKKEAKKAEKAEKEKKSTKATTKKPAAKKKTTTTKKTTTKKTTTKKSSK